MEQTRDHLEKPPATATGVGADMKRLKTDASSTAEEVREFIANIKGRSPQEVLGAVSESGLVQATLQATIGCVIVLGIFSVVPWLLRSEETATAATTDDAAATAETDGNSDTAADETGASSETASAGTRSGSDTPTDGDATRAAAAMKIDETAVTDPNTNPLDGNLDKLLDGLD